MTELSYFYHIYLLILTLIDLYLLVFLSYVIPYFVMLLCTSFDFLIRKYCFSLIRWLREDLSDIRQSSLSPSCDELNIIFKSRNLRRKTNVIFSILSRFFCTLKRFSFSSSLYFYYFVLLSLLWSFSPHSFVWFNLVTDHIICTQMVWTCWNTVYLFFIIEIAAFNI